MQFKFSNNTHLLSLITKDGKAVVIDTGSQRSLIDAKYANETELRSQTSVMGFKRSVNLKFKVSDFTLDVLTGDGDKSFPITIRQAIISRFNSIKKAYGKYDPEHELVAFIGHDTLSKICDSIDYRNHIINITDKENES